ncbi:MAG: hypothetical protein MUC57_05315 [Desulfobacterales bacterium]|nr:hypothetical protein [Desulfobacterales bacterium]
MKSIHHTKAFTLFVPIAKLFPLFTPEGEKAWVPGWDYENIMGTPELSEDYVFLTRKHDHGSSKAIWIVKKYDLTSHFVQYYKIEPETKIGVVSIKCIELEAAKTEVQVTYKYLSLSKNGDAFVSEFSEKVYEDFIGEWQHLLADYIKTNSVPEPQSSLSAD